MSHQSHRDACSCSRRSVLAGAVAAAASLALSRLDHGQTTLPGAVTIRPIKNAIAFVARPLPVSAIRLTGGPLKKAQDLDVQNLLRLEPDRMMYYPRQLAGLTPKAQQGYGSWDGPGRNLTGHIAGHYLSAVSYMYASTGDDRFKQRADYLVDEMEAVQNKRGTGYIGALMGNAPGGARGAAPIDGVQLFAQLSQGIIRAQAFDLNGMWSPWYVQHKIFAGLRDAYRQAGNRKALDLSARFAAWIESVLSPLSPQQLQQMLATEFGGINESLADLYADTGDSRWLDLSAKFAHRAIIDPLANRQDILAGQHGNTQVPKLLGELARYIYSGNAAGGQAARFFWQAVVDHHTFATGGHGYDEHFDAPDKLSDEVDGHNHGNGDRRTCESCNVYNMVKMTRLLFALEPDNRFAEFHERALFNHVLGSLNFNTGDVCYMVPVGQGQLHEYQVVGRDFTCCFGTGIENHARHGDGIYCESDDKFWVNIFAPSTAQSTTHGLKVAMDTAFPEADTSTLRLTLDAPKEFTLALRRPSWAGDGYAVAVNGQRLTDLPKPGSYVEIRRAWKTGDTVTFTLAKSLRTEPLPDNANRMALLLGPLVLGADFGPAASAASGRRGGAAAVSYPSFIAAPNQPIDQWLKPAADAPGTFHATGVGAANNEVTFKPFYQLSDRLYGIYQDVYTAEQWKQRGGT